MHDRRMVFVESRQVLFEQLEGLLVQRNVDGKEGWA